VGDLFGGFMELIYLALLVLLPFLVFAAVAALRRIATAQEAIARSLERQLRDPEPVRPDLLRTRPARRAELSASDTVRREE
jgi:hypothetical protein